MDMTSQVNNSHLIKGGFEFRRHTLFFHEFEIIPKKDESGLTIRPFEPAVALPNSIANNRYTHNPIEGAAYIQDKMEYEDLIINIGLRYDYFNASAKTPIELRDPDNARYFTVVSPNNDFTTLVR